MGQKVSHDSRTICETERKTDGGTAVPTNAVAARVIRQHNNSSALNESSNVH